MYTKSDSTQNIVANFLLKHSDNPLSSPNFVTAKLGDEKRSRF